MSNRVDSVPAQIDDYIAVCSGEPVLSETWRAYGRLGNYLCGHGGQLVNSNLGLPTVANILLSNSYNLYRYYIWPRGMTSTRLWMVRICGVVCLNETPLNLDCSGTIIVDEGGADEVTASWAVRGGISSTVFIVQPITTINSTPCETTIKIINSADSASSTWMEQISCIEAPRYDVSSTALACHRESLEPTKPIYYDAAPLTSVRSVMSVSAAMNGSLLIARRAALFHWYNVLSFSTQATTPGDQIISDEAVGLPEMTGRYIYSGDTVRTIRWGVYGYCPPGTSGHKGYVKATAAISGDTDTITLPATVGWTLSTLDIQAEDLTTEDGNQTEGVAELIKFEAYVDNAADTAVVYGISAGEYTD